MKLNNVHQTEETSKFHRNPCLCMFLCAILCNLFLVCVFSVKTYPFLATSFIFVRIIHKLRVVLAYQKICDATIAQSQFPNINISKYDTILLMPLT